ncbi:response regulator [Methylophaga sp. OBS3]|uniref:response regulator n=1 Tax=Methylophaga sp. OBS3 TaxID=2991934 RepID=UPI002256CA20|nr:response regulator [Methylophaga sp. OBS3]MCX4190736.1 response regulator [Methylophaga sp. OBS3]
MTNKLALVVDDSKVARLTLNKLLLAQQFDVVEHDSAENALAWLAQQTHLPSVIFMDLMMPGMDGLTATRTIKADGKLQAVPVVICTGNDSDIEKNAAVEAGAETVLAKPPASEALQQVLSQLPTKAAETAITAEPEAVTPTLDISAVISEVRQQIEQQALPALRVELAQQQSQQIDAAKQSIVDAVLPVIRQQIAASVAQSQSQSQQQVDTNQVSATVNSALEQAFQNFDVSEKWQAVLQQQSVEWLHQQQLSIESTMNTQLAEMISTQVQQQLSTQLNSAITPQLELAMAQQNAALTTQLQSQRAELENAGKRNVTLAWAAIGIALAALIISVI